MAGRRRTGWDLSAGFPGVGRNTARVILLTDSNSRIPVTIQPSGQRAILSGDNSNLPPIEFLESPELVRPGDRVVSVRAMAGCFRQVCWWVRWRRAPTGGCGCG